MLKGGANLRYFFGSERYSEDIDLDLIRPVPWSFENQVEAVLTSPALRSLLAIGELALVEHASAKQTETTHRWKVFDLERLLRRHPLAPGSLDPASVDAAVERALEQGYAAFRDQVLPFLEPGAAEPIASPGAWEQIQVFVVDALEAAR